MSTSLLRNSSAARIILVSLLVFTLGLALVSFYFLRQLEQETKQAIFAQQFSTVSLLADRIDRVLADQLVVLEGICRQFLVGEQLRPGEEIRQALDGRIHLKKIFNGGLLVLDLEARVVADSPPLPARQNAALTDSHHVQRIFALGQPLIGPPLMGRFQQKPLLPIGVPIRSLSGRPLGILVGLVDLTADNFINLEARHHYGESGGFLVVEPDSGLIIAGTEMERVFEPVPLPGSNQIHDQAMGGFEGSGSTVSSGISFLASVKQIPTAGWFAVARLPEAEALAPLGKLQQRLLLAAVIILAALWLTLAWFIKRQLDPLVWGADTLNEMTAGQKAIAPLPVRRNDELGRLLISFNHLLNKIQTAEEKFRAMAETSLDLIFQISAEGRITYCSPSAQTIMKRPPEEIIGTDFRTQVAPEDLGRAQRAFTTALGGDSIRLWEISLRQGGGSTFVGEVNIGPIKENGRVVGVQGVVRDVSARRRAAAALAEQLAFQKMVADISTSFVRAHHREIAVAVEKALALSGTFFRLDRAYVMLFDPASETLSNTHEWCAPGVTSFRDRIQQVAVVQYPWIIERIRREPFVHLPDIAGLPPEASAERQEFTSQQIKSMLLLPLAGPRGQLGFIGYDSVRRARFWNEETITLLTVVAEAVAGALARHEMEDAIQRQSAELARSNRELARSNAELTDFAHIASHDLQEPLRKVIAFGDRLRLKYAEVLDEKGLDYLSRMQNAAERMQQLIDDLLQYARVTTQGREFARVDLNEILTRVRDSLERASEEAGAEIRVEPLPVVSADERQMQSLFQNLIGNAVKYRRPGVAPEIMVRPRAVEEAWLEIAVIDNGIGFEEKYLDRIFRPFQRLHGRSEYQGSGIGLAICKKIVERHGGELRATSTVGFGSTFVVRLPR